MIEVRNLRKSFDSLEVLKDINLETRVMLFRYLALQVRERRRVFAV